MLNHNGKLVDSTVAHFKADNRAINYGDAVFETIKFCKGRLLFWEDHYFRLMASMRILRMEIPMNFTLEHLEDEIRRTLISQNLENGSARVKLLVYRKSGGYYRPQNRDVEYLVAVTPLEQASYQFNPSDYVVDLYKDFYVSPGLLSTLKTTGKILNVLGSIYAEENGLDNCLILNTDKSVIEALNGNVFIVKGSVIKTPPLNDGCLKGIMRKQLIDVLSETENYELEETPISPFELQKADELFLTNVIQGIQPVSRYRKKRFTTNLSETLINKLNEKLELA